MTVISKFFCTKAKELPGMAAFRDYLKKQMQKQVESAEIYDGKVRVDIGKEIIVKLKHGALEHFHKVVVTTGLIGAGGYYMHDTFLSNNREARERAQHVFRVAKEARDQEKFAQDMESSKLMIDIQRMELAKLKRQELESMQSKDVAKTPSKKFFFFF